MAIGQYPEGAYRLQTEDWVTRGSGRVSGSVNPSVELLIDRKLPVRAHNNFFGSFARPGQILAGVDMIMSIAGMEQDEMGYHKPVLTICNGTSLSVTESNGYVRPANMHPVGNLFQHAYNYIDDRLIDRLRPAIDRSQYLMVPLIKDPYYADSVWTGAAVGGSGTTMAPRGATNSVGQAYNVDYRLNVAYDLRVGDYVQSDHMGHFMKWIPDDTSAATLAASEIQKIGQVLYIENIPMRGLLQTVMLKATNGMRRMYGDYDYMQPYPVPYGKDPRAFLQNDKSFWPTNYGEIDEYGWPSHLKDFMGIPGLTDGVRMVQEVTTEVFSNVAVTNSQHIITTTNKPIARSEAGAVNPTMVEPSPSKLVIEFDALANGFASGVVTLKENKDYKVNRHTGVVVIMSNNGAALAATDDYRFTYTWLNNQTFGIPTNADWKGSVGLAYICTFFNK